jgi:hypothetical protein
LRRSTAATRSKPREGRGRLNAVSPQALLALEIRLVVMRPAHHRESMRELRLKDSLGAASCGNQPSEIKVDPPISVAEYLLRCSNFLTAL